MNYCRCLLWAVFCGCLAVAISSASGYGTRYTANSAQTADASATPSDVDPQTLAQARKIITQLRTENAALRAENAELKARLGVETREGKQRPGRSPAQTQFLSALEETRAAIEAAEDGPGVFEIIEKAEPTLTAAAAKCGFQWGPFEEQPPFEPKIFHSAVAAQEEMQIAALKPIIIRCRYPRSGQPLAISVNDMTKADWQRILDVISEWRKAAGG